MNKYPPGPKGHIVLGSITDLLSDAFGTLTSAAQLGDIAHLRLLHKHAYVLNRPDIVYKVLAQEADKFYKDDSMKGALKPWLGNGLLINDGSPWRAQRKLVQPAFHHSRIQSYLNTMVFYVEELAKHWQPDHQINVKQEMSKLALSIVGKALFETDDVSGITATVGEGMDTMRRIVGQEMRSINLPDWMPIRLKLEKKQTIARLDEVIYNIVSIHRRDGCTDSFLAMLLETTDENGQHMTDKQIRDEALTLFIAGHETTAIMLTWTWYLLGLYPEVAEKLYAEVDEVIGDKPLTLEMLPRLTYTDMIIKESMRMYPISWLFTRQPLQDITLGDYTVKKGSLLLVNAYSLHHDPRYFADPEQFIPERWTGDYEKRLPRGVYFPFGLGPRVCIGQQFALMEAKVALATVARHYRLVTDQKQISPKDEGTLVPSGPVMATVSRRERIPVQ